MFINGIFGEATEKGVIPVHDAGIHLRKSLCCKEIDYRVKSDNDNFRSFSATLFLGRVSRFVSEPWSSFNFWLPRNINSY